MKIIIKKENLKQLCKEYYNKIKQYEEILKDKITDYEELKFENNRLSDKNKQLEQEKAELTETLISIRKNTDDRWIANRVTSELSKHS